MKFLIVLISLFLIGCAHNEVVPVVPKFPEPYTVGVKKELAKCSTLQTQPGEEVPITELLKTIANNYKLYYDCAEHVEKWNEWYKKQRDNFENIKK